MLPGGKTTEGLSLALNGEASGRVGVRRIQHRSEGKGAFPFWLLLGIA